MRRAQSYDPRGNAGQLPHGLSRITGQQRTCAHDLYSCNKAYLKKKAAKLLSITFRSMRYRVEKYNLGTTDDLDDE